MQTSDGRLRPHPALLANRRWQTATHPALLANRRRQTATPSALFANKRLQTAEEIAVRREPNREGVGGKLPPTAASRVCCFFLCAPSQKRGHTKNTNALLSRRPHTPETRTHARAKGAGLLKSCRGVQGARSPMRGGSRKSRTGQARWMRGGQPQEPDRTGAGDP